MGLWSGLRLDMDRHRAVTLVGGGGKTTTMYALAREAREAGKRVIVTTTTHIMPTPASSSRTTPTRSICASAWSATGSSPWAPWAGRTSCAARERPAFAARWPTWSWWRGTGPGSGP